MQLGVRVAAFICFLGVLTLTQAAVAQEVDDSTRASARRLGYAGVEAYEKSDYGAASEKLERAFGVLQVPTLGLWSARALAKLNRLVEAQERYLKVTQLSPGGGDIEVQRKAQTDAVQELAALEPRIPALHIELKGAAPREVALYIDDVRVAPGLVGEPRLVDPGQHSVVVERGTDRRKVSVTVGEAQQQRVVVDLASPSWSPEAAAPPSKALRPLAGGSRVEADTKLASSSRRTLGWVTIIAGGAGLVFGGVTGALVLGKQADLESNTRCSDDACGPSQQGAVGSYNSARTLSMVGFIAGGVLATAGVVIVLTAPSAEQSNKATLWLGPGGAGVQGHF